MSTLAIRKIRKKMGRTGWVYLFLTLFCILFGAIYEVFSHGVFSYFMLYAFVVPLVGGVIPFFAIGYGGKKIPGIKTERLWHFGIATLTIGCFVCGILEIYGTTNRLTIVYWLAGGAVLLIGMGSYLLDRRDISRHE